MRQLIGPGSNALGAPVCHWLAIERCLSTRGPYSTKIRPCHGSGLRGPDIPPPHPEENYHLQPNENFRIENPQLYCTTTKRGLDTYEYTDNTLNIRTGSRHNKSSTQLI